MKQVWVVVERDENNNFERAHAFDNWRAVHRVSDENKGSLGTVIWPRYLTTIEATLWDSYDEYRDVESKRITAEFEAETARRMLLAKLTDDERAMLREMGARFDE